MLVITVNVNKNEGIKIDNTVKIYVSKIKNNQIVIAFDAPETVKINRFQYEKTLENNGRYILKELQSSNVE